MLVLTDELHQALRGTGIRATTDQAKDHLVGDPARFLSFYHALQAEDLLQM
jgi:hypothetical protein